LAARIGIFGGTFDPVHNGHLRAAHSFLESGLIDEIWVLLTPDPPHKTDRSQADYSHRLEMLKLAFSRLDKVHINTVEKELSSPSYSLKTIQHLKKTYPDHTFFLCLGEDSIRHFHIWYKYREILKLCSIIAVERPGFDSSNVEKSILERTIFAEHVPMKVSSTQIRSEDNIAPHVPKPVADYIKKHKLYPS
jgi:nicotinate-nucleotide adenylyltransferase